MDAYGKNLIYNIICLKKRSCTDTRLKLLLSIRSLFTKYFDTFQDKFAIRSGKLSILIFFKVLWHFCIYFSKKKHSMEDANP